MSKTIEFFAKTLVVRFVRSGMFGEPRHVSDGNRIRRIMNQIDNSGTVKREMALMCGVKVAGHLTLSFLH